MDLHAAPARQMAPLRHSTGGVGRANLYTGLSKARHFRRHTPERSYFRFHCRSHQRGSRERLPLIPTIAFPRHAHLLWKALGAPLF
jgi:hypothetical protein